MNNYSGAKKPTLEFVLSLAKKADELILSAYGGLKDGSSPSSQKASRSDIVTETDIAVEKLLISLIKESFPDHAFYCEESDHAQFNDGPTWCIDPIDGNHTYMIRTHKHSTQTYMKTYILSSLSTILPIHISRAGTSNFFHTFPHHACSIAYCEGKQTVLAVVSVPACKETFAAEKGKGATLNGQPIKCAPKRPLAEALVATGFCSVVLHRKRQENLAAARDTVIKNFSALLDHSRDIRRMGASAADLCFVACGRLDAYAEAGPRAWDVAAGSLILGEAGGVCVTYDGTPLQYAQNGALHVVGASSEDLAKELVKILTPLDSRVLADED